MEKFTKYETIGRLEECLTESIKESNGMFAAKHLLAATVTLDLLFSLGLIDETVKSDVTAHFNSKLVKRGGVNVENCI